MRVKNRPPASKRLTDNPYVLEIDGILDLHHFRPREVPDLIQEYLRECRLRNIGEVRIIHGKGKGVLRALVQDILSQHPDVIEFGPAQDRSGWGATVARLRVRQTPINEKKVPHDQESPNTRGSIWHWLWPWRH